MPALIKLLRRFVQLHSSQVRGQAEGVAVEMHDIALPLRALSIFITYPIGLGFSLSSILLHSTNLKGASIMVKCAKEIVRYPSVTCPRLLHKSSTSTPHKRAGTTSK